MRLTLERRFPPILNAAQRYLLRRQIRSYEPYHPVYIGADQWAAGERTCSDRWSMVSPSLQRLSPSSLLDLGCAEGYFVQKAAQDLNCIGLGIDADIRRLTIARLSATLNEVPGVAFMQEMIDVRLLQKLPPYDVVIFLSVLHHVMYEHGEDYALQLMTAIHRTTRKCLIFDMGQSNEISHSWAKLLPDMTPDAVTWISAFLTKAGFSLVEVVGHTDAYKSAERRHLFIAYV